MLKTRYVFGKDKLMKLIINKKWKIIIGIVAVLLVFVIVLSSVLANLQYAKQNTALFSEARDVLLSTFDAIEFGENANLKKVIDNKNPVNFVNYNGEDNLMNFWGALSEKQRKNTVIVLVAGQLFLPNCEPNKHNLEKWADMCENNNIPYVIQCITGETHMEARPPLKYLEDRFAKRHNSFLGLNASELYNGVTWRGKAESDNTRYIIDLLKLCAKYGGYFVWTDTNLNYKNGMILDWLEGNESFYSAFKQYSKNICMLNQESIADPTTYGLMQGLWLAGLIGNWGVASDWWHWKNDGNKSLFGENDKYVGNDWEQIFSYPENMYVQSMMLAVSRGATCFSQDSPTFAISYKGSPIAGYQYAISPFWERLIDGRIAIPNATDIYAATGFAVLGKQNYNLKNYNFNESDLYPAQGQSGVVPLLPSNLRSAERRLFTERGITLVDYKVSNSAFMKAFGENDSNTYLTNVANNWYFINNLENKQGSKYAKFTPRFAGAESFYIESDEHASAVIADTSSGFKVYVSNYRTDKSNMIMQDSNKMNEFGSIAEYVSRFLTLDIRENPKGVDDTALRKTVIEIKGSLNGGEPTIKWSYTTDGYSKYTRKYNYTKNYDATTQILRLEIEHNGIVEFEVSYDDTGKKYNPAMRPLIEDNYGGIEADTTELAKLVETKILDRHKYTYFSYLEYDKAYEKAVVMLTEKIYTQSQVNNQIKVLKKAINDLINVEKEVNLLKTILAKDNNQAIVWEAYDYLLRELLSCQKYVNGRSNDLKYASIYRNKSINCTFATKRNAINSAYKKLSIYA